MPTMRTPTEKGGALNTAEAEAIIKRPVVAQAVNYNLTVAHNREVHELGGTVDTVTLPTVSNSFAETDDWRVTLVNILATAVTVARENSQTINGVAANLTIPAYERVTLWMDSAFNGFWTDSYYSRVHGFMAWLTTDRTLTTGVVGDIIFDTENYDTEDSYNPVTGVFTVPAWATKMQVSVNLDYDTNATGRRQAFLTQGIGAISLPKPFWSVSGLSAAGPTNVGGTSGWINVVAGSTYIVTGYQDSGGNLNVTGSANHRSYLSVVFGQ